MKPESILFVLALICWVYLIDPFCSRPLNRNYLRLYEDKKFLIISLLIAMTFLISGYVFITSDPVIPFAVLPAVFIVIDLLLIKISISHLGRPFCFIQRGDLVKGEPADRLYSFMLLAGPFLLSFISAYLISVR
ncbi:hypothetical protein [Pedobacter sp. UYP1]|uniref:hypothetical protein n=1 Tax=Pedobacter sp. UYP1 TaxID=1756396 RepID=UPI003392B74C